MGTLAWHSQVCNWHSVCRALEANQHKAGIRPEIALKHHPLYEKQHKA